MSNWASPIVAANTAVRAPTVATTPNATGDIENRKCRRTIMYTPAVTIVAAWINALTGVGPAMASGSQTYSGICADFPAAPTNRHSAASVTAGTPKTRWPSR